VRIKRQEIRKKFAEIAFSPSFSPRESALRPFGSSGPTAVLQRYFFMVFRNTTCVANFIELIHRLGNAIA
jgi:hypothetical protein